LFDGENTIEIGPLEGPISQKLSFGPWVKIPEQRFKDKNNDIDKYIQQNIETKMFWLSDFLLFVNQRNQDTQEIICKTLNIYTLKWQTIASNCINNIHFDVVKFIYNNRDKLLIEESRVANSQRIFINH